MEMKRIGYLIFIGCIITSISVYLCEAKKKIYYIPEYDFYIGISVAPKDDYGYIYFSRNNRNIFEKKDFIKMYKALDNVIVQMFLKANSDTIYYIPLSKANEIKQTEFVFIDNEQLDSNIFYYDSTYPFYYRIKQEYIKTITLYDFNSDIYVSQDSSNEMRRLEPIGNNRFNF